MTFLWRLTLTSYFEYLYLYRYSCLCLVSALALAYCWLLSSVCTCSRSSSSRCRSLSSLFSLVSRVELRVFTMLKNVMLAAENKWFLVKLIQFADLFTVSVVLCCVVLCLRCSVPFRSVQFRSVRSLKSRCVSDYSQNKSIDCCLLHIYCMNVSKRERMEMNT